MVALPLLLLGTLYSGQIGYSIAQEKMYIRPKERNPTATNAPTNIQNTTTGPNAPAPVEPTQPQPAAATTPIQP